MTSVVEYMTLAALAVLCLALRWAGLLMPSNRGSPRTQRLINGVPAPLLAALIASSAMAQGTGAAIAVVAAVGLMIVLRNEILAAAAAVLFAVLLV